MVPKLPIAWGGDSRPHTIIGSRDLRDVSFLIDVRLTNANGSVMIGARMGGIPTSTPYGDYYGALFSFDVDGSWNLTASTTTVQSSGAALASGQLPHALGVGGWHRFRLDVNGSSANVWVDGTLSIQNVPVAFAGASGFVTMGTVQFGHFTDFDNLELYSTQKLCSPTKAPSAGDRVVAISCSSEVGSSLGGRFDFFPQDPQSCPLGSPCANSSGTFALASDHSLCLAVGGENALVLATCASGAPSQIFTQEYSQLYKSSLLHKASGMTVMLITQDIGSQAYVSKNASKTEFVYLGDEQEIVSINVFSVCLGTCSI